VPFYPTDKIRNRKVVKNEDTSKYYADKGKLWSQAYAPDKRSLVEFLKNEMIMGLNDAELKETCMFFMPERPQGKRERGLKAKRLSMS